MALIDCPECEKRVSDLAPNCPSCGVEIAKGGTESVAETRLTRLAKGAQIVTAVAIPVIGIILAIIQEKRLEEEQIANEKNEMAEKMIRVVEMLKDDSSKRAAAFLALSFYRQQQLDPSIIVLLAEAAVEENGEQIFYDEVRATVVEMQGLLGAKINRLRNDAAAADDAKREEILAKVTRLEEAMEKARKRLGVVGESPESKEEKTETLADATQAVENGPAHVAKDQTAAALQVAVVDVPDEGATDPDGGGESESSDLEQVGEKLGEITDDALKEVGEAADVLASEQTPQTTQDASRKEAAEAALMRTNAVLQGAVEAKKAAEEAVESAQEGSPDDVQRTEEAQRKTTDAVAGVVQRVYEKSRAELHNAELREEVFKGLDIHRLVVAFAREEQREEADALMEDLRQFLGEKLGTEVELVAVLEDIVANEKSLGRDIEEPTHHEFRYQAGDLASEEIARRIGEYLEEKGLNFEPKPLPASQVAKLEYELWFGLEGPAPAPASTGSEGGASGSEPAPPPPSPAPAPAPAPQ